MREQRARFGAAYRTKIVSLNLVDGGQLKFEGPDAASFAVKIPDRPHPITAADMLKAELLRKKQSILELCGNQALATAAHHGECTVIYRAHFGLDTVSELTQIDGRNVSAIDVEYEIRITREADA